MNKILFSLATFIFTFALNAHANFNHTCPPSEAIHCISNNCILDASYNDWEIINLPVPDNSKFSFDSAEADVHRNTVKCFYISSISPQHYFALYSSRTADFDAPGNKWKTTRSKVHCPANGDINACPLK